MKDKLLEIPELIREDVVNICVDPHTDYLDDKQFALDNIDEAIKQVNESDDIDEAIKQVNEIYVEQSKL